jgi:tetratricopeptide (TPR) repeat protein
LGLPRNAILKDIESAYQKISTEFSDQNIMKISDPSLKGKAYQILEKINRAYEVLSDYNKRAEYEKRGYRELSAEDIPEDDPIEVAKEFCKKAKTLYNRQDYNMAIAALEQAIKLDPTKPEHYYLLGLCQSKLPALKREAEQNLLKASDMEPWNAEILAALGMLFYSEKLYTRAESYFRKALVQEPSHALAKKRLEEIVGPEKKTMDSVKDGLSKVFPTFFGKKKK